MDLAALHLDLLAFMPLIGGLLGGALVVFLATTLLTASSIPGLLIPMSLASGVLLGPGLGVASVAAGALTGSLLLFGLTRRFGAGRLRSRFGTRLEALELRLGQYGPAAVVGLRILGAPGPLVTAGAALTTMRTPVFAAATLAGLLPAIGLAAAGPHLLLF